MLLVPSFLEARLISASVNKSIAQNFTVSYSKIKYYSASLTGIQGNTLVSNSTLFPDITNKCVFSTVPVTNTSWNIKSNKKSYSSLSSSNSTSKCLLSTVSQIKTSNDKSYSSSYSKIYSKPIAKDVTQPARDVPGTSAEGPIKVLTILGD